MKIKCLECGWTGDDSELEGDYISAADYGGEIWSNHICPSCHNWGDEDDYLKIEDKKTTISGVEQSGSLLPS